MYFELILAIHEAFNELPCDICNTTGTMRRVALNTHGGRLLGIPYGIYHLGCAYALAAAIQQETQER